MKVKIRGKKHLEGIIETSGSKNSAVAIIPAAILCDEPLTIRNVPDIHDVQTLLDIMKEIGCGIDYKDNILKLTPAKKLNYRIQTEKVKKLRGSYYFMGSFLGKIHKISIFNSGGCNLGNRPINYHLDGFQKLGAKIQETDHQVFLKAHKLKGTEIDLGFPSVGATINLMLAAVRAKGTTVIRNCAIEPEITDVGDFLIAMGADIQGLGTPTITIVGVRHLHSCDYTIISDRIEAGTYLILGAIATGKGITVRGIDPKFLISLTDTLVAIGCQITTKEKEITVCRTKPLIPCSIVTKPYPGFPTDLGQIITVLMTQIEGTSQMKETIFSNRFSHVEELKKMGANLSLIDDTIYVNGITPLKSAKLYAYDLRGAAALVLAATLNRGITVIDNIDVLLRGYEKPIEKLQDIGLKIELVE
jgi:UDP-N-acetylglucosamine 1-carboxyvinyltransferase